MDRFLQNNDLAQAALLHRISRIVSTGQSLDEMLGEILGVAVEVSACDACLVYLIERGTGEFVPRASWPGIEQPPGKSAVNICDIDWAAKMPVVALTSRAAEDPRYRRFPPLSGEVYEAFVSVPLVSGGECAGVMNLHFRRPREYSADLIALLTFIGEQAGGAVVRNGLAEENRSLREAALEMKEQLETRKLVERAKGILMQRYSLSEEEAYLRLRNDSRRSRRAMRDLAGQIIQAEIEQFG